MHAVTARSDALLAIALMAAVTYATRVGGLVLMPRLPRRPWLERWLEHLPGSVLAALVAPIVLAAGVAGAIAAAATVIVASRTGGIVLPMATGVAAVWLLRSAGLG